MTIQYAVAVGANRGEHQQTFALAERLLQADGMLRIFRKSGWHTSAAQGGPAGQDAFTNGVWILSTDLGPHQLLHRLQMVETACGRFRTVRWGSRTLDLDLLLSDDGAMIANAVLTLPHQRWRERAFVLTPLAEVAPDWRDPETRLTVAELARQHSG